MTNPHKNIDLIHPLYLDVPMLVSFAAAIEGGVSYGSEFVRERSNESTSGAEISGTFGLSQLFSSLFHASVDAKASGEISTEERTKEVQSRNHTEASLAILLYDNLSKHDGYIEKPNNIDDFKKLVPGLLVELEGTVEKNAVDTMIDIADAGETLVKFNNLEQTSQKKQKNYEPKSPFTIVKDTLDEDRNRTPISNVLLRCSIPGNPTAVLTLRKDYLRDLTMSELHKNSVRVLGKVTRIVRDDERMSTFENYGLSLLQTETLEDVFHTFKAEGGLKIEFSDIEIAGPALQLLPLMIYV